MEADGAAQTGAEDVTSAGARGMSSTDVDVSVAQSHKRPPLAIGVLISGSGTNLQAIIDKIAERELNARVCLVVSSRPGVAGIERAEKAGIPTLVMEKSDYDNPIAADERIVEALSEAADGEPVEYVIMAGYMRKVTDVLLGAFPDRIVNLHPALLPSFVGAHAIQDAFDAGVKVTGVTVHFANAAYDEGPIIAQQPVHVNENDTADTLEQRIHVVEHALYPKVIQMLAEHRVSVVEAGDGRMRHAEVAPKIY